MKYFLMVAAAMLATAGGCFSVSNTELIGRVRPQAAFDLACPEKQIEVSLLGGNPRTNASYGAIGCGKRARYETHCVDAMASSCLVQTQMIEGAVPPPPPPAP